STVTWTLREALAPEPRRTWNVCSPGCKRQGAVYGYAAVATGRPSTYQTTSLTGGSTTALKATVLRSAGVSGSRSSRAPFSGEVIRSRVGPPARATLPPGGQADAGSDAARAPDCPEGSPA